MDAPRSAPRIGLVLDRIACPVCGRTLTIEGPGLRCAAGHGFDLARQGHVSLFNGSRPNTADSADMVDARDRFLSAGHYGRIARAVSDAIPADARGMGLDLGGGTGHYLAEVLRGHPPLVGLDLDPSVAALKRAMRQHERIAAVAADAWRTLPVRDAAAAAVLSVFSPRNAAEIARVLEPGGRLVVVTPTPHHLHELVGELGLVTVDPRKPERLADSLRGLANEGSERLEYRIALDRDAVEDVVLMGPSARHLTREALRDRIDGPREVTVSVTVAIYAHGTFGPAPGADRA